MYSRKLYVAVAQIIKARSDVLATDKLTMTQSLCVADDFADLFASDNPRFDRNRFLDACKG